MESLQIPHRKFSNETSSDSRSYISNSDGHAEVMPNLIVLPNCLRKINPKQDLVLGQIYNKIGQRIPPDPRFSFVFEVKIEAGLYSGQTKNNIPEGLGILKQSKNWTYYGEWKSGFPQGLGCLDCKNEGFYIGKFKKGQYHGHGKFVKGKNYYIGGWKNNLEHGHGKRCNEGVIYEGQFKKGLRHGQGSYKDKSLKVSGSFDYDSLVFGKSVDLDSGCRYQGEWRNNRSNGRGTLKFTKSSGSIFRRLSGFFKDGQFVRGKGTIMGCKTVFNVEMK